MSNKRLRQNRNILIAGLILISVILVTYSLRYKEAPAPFPPPPLSTLPSFSQPTPSPNLPHIDIPELAEPLPLVYSETLEETKIQQYLKEGAVVLPLGTTLGKPGNVVITAHSSGFESFGPYRFAFAKLGELEEGQEFQITDNFVTYTYRVYAKEIVWPTEVDKLPQDDRSTVTLVTCWPIWTNFKRLLVHAELIGVEK